MKKYKVLVEGKNVFLNVEDKACRVDFFTTRYVEVPNKSEVENMVLPLIQQELHSVVLNAQSNPPILLIQEVQEVESFGENLVPGTGFTFYYEETAPMK